MSDDSPSKGTALLPRLGERTKANIPLSVLASLVLGFAWWTNSRLSALEVAQAGATVWQQEAQRNIGEIRDDVKFIRDHMPRN